jgi:DNA-binding MurR/RpiR family transcriptional regulator
MTTVLFDPETRDNFLPDTFDSNASVFETLVDSPDTRPKLGCMGSTEIVELIKANLDGMPVQMQSAARFIIDHPSEVALLSMREQARKAGVPPATMTRLAQRIGFPGYQDLKDTYAEAIRDNVAWFSGRAVNMLSRRREYGEVSLVTETIDAITRAINELRRPAAIEKLLKAADILHRAQRIYCIGARATFPVAFLFDYTQRYYSDKIRLLEGAGGSGVDLMHRISSKDALLAVSLSPYATSTQRTVKLAHAAGATVVAITDTEASPVARKADVSILISARSPSFFDTISPALASAEILVALLASRAGPDVPKKVRQHERHLQDAGVFWNSTKRSQNDSE